MDTKLLRIYQLLDGYCYNSDSLFLFDFAKKFLRKSIEVLDIGCGSGILGLLCARDFSTKTTLIEKDIHNAYLAQKNSILNHIESHIIYADILETKFKNKFHLIITNPPFYREGILDSKNTKIALARNEKFMPFDLLCKKVKSILHPNGHFVFCYDAKEAHRIFYTLREIGFNARFCRFVYPRINKDATLILIEAKINSKSSLKVLPPLITHNSSNQKDNTLEVQKIYQQCNTYSIKVNSKDIKDINASLFTLPNSL